METIYCWRPVSFREMVLTFGVMCKFLIYKDYKVYFLTYILI